MAKLIAFTTPSSDKVLINPDHIVEVFTHPTGVTVIVLSNYSNDSREVERVVQSLEEVERMVNGVNNA